MHNGIHKVKLASRQTCYDSVFFLVFAYEFQISGAQNNNSNHRGKLPSSKRNLISMVERE